MPLLIPSFKVDAIGHWLSTGDSVEQLRQVLHAQFFRLAGSTATVGTHNHVDQLPKRAQAIMDIIVGTISITFFGLTVWQIALYATDMVISGEVSPTTKTPFYPFVYGVAFGFLVLCLVLLVDLIKSIGRAVGR